MTLDAVVFDRDYLTIYHEPDTKLIHLKWKGYASSEQLREALNFALDTVREHHVELWLGDLKQMEAVLPQDEAWTAQDWVPRLASTGIRKLAMVTSLDYFNNMSMKRVANSTSGIARYETRFFVDTAEARAWLLREF